MSRDRLFLLEAGFTDDKHPGDAFVCPDGLPIEGLLASAPEQAARIEVHRLPFPRPRAAVVAVLDEAHQSLPVLVFGDESPAPADAHTRRGQRFLAPTPRHSAEPARR
ncbi:DUF3088 family protein, partial [Variovorax sp. CT11-76]